MTRKGFISTAGVAAAVTALTLALTGPASAVLTTRCVGEGGAVTVPGDLVVPAGQTCVLEGTVVQGNVRVAPGADLIVVDATVDGAVRVTEDAYFDALDSQVAGQVITRDAYGVYLAGTELGGNLISRLDGASDIPGFVLAEDLTAAADVRVLGGELSMEASDVTGRVIARDALYADLYESFIDGGLVSVRNELGALVCDSAILGDSRVAGNRLGVQLGGDGALETCAGGSYWGGDVEVSNNSGGVFIDDNIVDGDLVLDGNDPVATLGDGNLVRGSVIGDFQVSDGAAASVARLQVQVASRDQVAVADRGAALGRLVDTRRSTATTAAEAAGQAF